VYMCARVGKGGEGGRLAIVTVKKLSWGGGGEGRTIGGRREIETPISFLPFFQPAIPTQYRKRASCSGEKKKKKEKNMSRLSDKKKNTSM
jgi:hypothetical protein